VLPLPTLLRVTVLVGVGENLPLSRTTLRNRERLAAKALERYHSRVRKAKLEAAVVELEV